MKSLTLSVFLAACTSLAGAAYAQEAPSAPPAYVPTSPFTAQSDSGPPHWAGDPWRGEPSQAMPRSIDAGIAALEANDFTRAEAIFKESQRYYGSDPTFRFYMGVAKMNLGKWDEARRYLRTAARELRKLPDPKSHLGVTYAKLGDVDAANVQRAYLVKMAEACKGTCELSSYITSGIQMIDKALAEAPNASGQG